MQEQKKDNLIIVYYDGHCALCHGLVKFVINRIQAKQILLAPIQGETFLKKHGSVTKTPNTVIVELANGDTLDRSSAIAEILLRIGGVWHLLGKVILVFPKVLRDLAYKIVSALRYKIFGKTSTLCPIVTTELKKYFLP